MYEKLILKKKQSKSPPIFFTVGQGPSHFLIHTKNTKVKIIKVIRKFNLLLIQKVLNLNTIAYAYNLYIILYVTYLIRIHNYNSHRNIIVLYKI